jgi:hypothetical protein
MADPPAGNKAGRLLPRSGVFPGWPASGDGEQRQHGVELRAGNSGWKSETRAGRQEVRAVPPIDGALIHQPDVGFVYQRRRLQGVAGCPTRRATWPSAASSLPRQPAQLAVENRRHGVRSGLIPFTPVHQQLSESCGANLRSFNSSENSLSRFVADCCVLLQKGFSERRKT